MRVFLLNMKRKVKVCLEQSTPLFLTCMVQAQEEMGEVFSYLLNPYHYTFIDCTNRFTSQPQKKQPRRKQRKDTEVSMIDKTQGRNDDNLMFDTSILDEQEVEVEKVVSTAEVTTYSATTTTVNELTLDQEHLIVRS
ncbi:hypothetical protein Tco_0668891 [Tanacetum coccineum]